MLMQVQTLVRCEKRPSHWTNQLSKAQHLSYSNSWVLSKLGELLFTLGKCILLFHLPPTFSFSLSSSRKLPSTRYLASSSLTRKPPCLRRLSTLSSSSSPNGDH